MVRRCDGKNTRIFSKRVLDYRFAVLTTGAEVLAACDGPQVVHLPTAEAMAVNATSAPRADAKSVVEEELIVAVETTEAPTMTNMPTSEVTAPTKTPLAKIAATENPPSTPSSTPAPELPTPTPEPSWQYIGFTYSPIIFNQTLVEEPSCTSGTMLMPFFNYLNTNHAEGPKKWYIKACAGDPVKVYLPSKALLRKHSINVSSNEGIYNGQKVITDVKVYFEVSPDISLFFMHLTLLADVKSQVEKSLTEYSVLETGTHIGYLYAPNQTRYSLDFGVEDKSVDPELTSYDDHWWNIRENLWITSFKISAEPFWKHTNTIIKGWWMMAPLRSQTLRTVAST